MITSRRIIGASAEKEEPKSAADLLKEQLLGSQTAPPPQQVRKEKPAGCGGELWGLGGAGQEGSGLAAARCAAALLLRPAEALRHDAARLPPPPGAPRTSRWASAPPPATAPRSSCRASTGRATNTSEARQAAARMGRLTVAARPVAQGHGHLACMAPHTRNTNTTHTLGPSPPPATTRWSPPAPRSGPRRASPPCGCRRPATACPRRATCRGAPGGGGWDPVLLLLFAMVTPATAAWGLS